MSEWISVKDRLPNYNDAVFLTRDECVFVGMKSNTDIEGEWYITLDHPKQPKPVEKITHWMPIKFPSLPKPPTEK